MLVRAMVGRPGSGGRVRDPALKADIMSEVGRVTGTVVLIGVCCACYFAKLGTETGGGVERRVGAQEQQKAGSENRTVPSNSSSPSGLNPPPPPPPPTSRPPPPPPPPPVVLVPPLGTVVPPLGTVTGRLGSGGTGPRHAGNHSKSGQVGGKGGEATEGCQEVPEDQALVVHGAGECAVQVMPKAHLEKNSYVWLQATGKKLRRALRKEARETELGVANRKLQYVFVRHVTEWGSEIDLLLNPFTAAPSLPLFGKGRPKRFDWYFAAHKIFHCMGCGYSCNLFGFMYYHDRRLSNPVLPYPLRKPPVQVFIPGFRRDPKYPKGLGKAKCLIRCGTRMGAHVSDGGHWQSRPFMEFFHINEHPEVLLTARRLGYYTQNRTKDYSTVYPAGKCSTTITKPAIVFGKLEWPDLPRDNFAHWFHDVFFPLFMKIMYAVGVKGMPTSAGHFEGEGYIVVIDERDFQNAVVGGLGWLLNILAPNRTSPKPGLCLQRAYFDCPAPASMKPTYQLQQWLAGVGWLYAPLPLTYRPVLVLMLRLPGGSRFIRNWEALVETATALGWEVKVPLDPRRGMKVNDQKALRDVLLPAIRSAHCVVGFHGSELALMPLMHNRSVVVEICPRDYRYMDTWYVEQAEAQGLRLLRWAPSNTTATYGNKYPTVDKYTPGWWRARPADWDLPIPEFAAVLRAARRLLDHPG
eukprot:Hpha_TRINITY_DN13849_c0_g3::TRINITY_DN13849_c0_g3_i2::g.69848::m.69848